jgi:hypothetical protein
MQMNDRTKYDLGFICGALFLEAALWGLGIADLSDWYERILAFLFIWVALMVAAGQGALHTKNIHKK